MLLIAGSEPPAQLFVGPASKKTGKHDAGSWPCRPHAIVTSIRCANPIRAIDARYGVPGIVSIDQDRQLAVEKFAGTPMREGHKLGMYERGYSRDQRTMFALCEQGKMFVFVPTCATDPGRGRINIHG